DVCLCISSPRSLHSFPTRRSSDLNPGSLTAAAELDREGHLAKLVNDRMPHVRSEARPRMLPPFIIEQIRRREEEEREERPQPRLELPVDAYGPAPRRERDDDEDEEQSDRGVIILDLG